MAVQTVVIDISQMKKDIQKKQKIEDRLGKSMQKTKNQVLKIDNTKSMLDLKVTDTTIKVLYKIAKGLERETRALEELPQKAWKMMKLFLNEFDNIMRKTNRLLEKILDKLGRPPNKNATSITNMGVSSSVPKAVKVKPKIKFSTGSTSDRFHEAVDESIGTGVRISKNVGTGFGELKKGIQPFKEPAKKLGKSVGNRLATRIGAAGLTLGTDIKLRGAAAETSLHTAGSRVQSSMETRGIGGEAALTGFGASLESGIKGFGTYLKTRLTTAGSSMGGSIGGIVTSFGGILESGMNTLGSAANTVFKTAGTGFKKAFKGMGGIANSFIKGFGTALKKASDKIGNGIISVTGNIKTIAKRAFGIASMIGGIVKGIVGGIVGFFKNLMKAAWEGIKNWGIKPMMQYENTMGASQGYQYLFAKKGMASNEFEQRLDNEIAMDSPYSREDIHNYAKGYYNISKNGNIDEVIDDMKWTQDIGAAFGLNTEGYSNMLSAVAQNKNDQSVVTLDDIDSMFGNFPALELFTAAAENGKVTDKTVENTAKKVQNGEITKKEFIEGLEFAATMEDPIEITLDKYSTEKNAKRLLEGPVKGAAKALADGSISGLKTKLANIFDSKIMSKWSTGLSIGMSRGLSSIGNFLDEHVQDIENIGLFLQDVGEDITNALSDAFEATFKNINDLIGSDEFKNATLDEKMQMFWKQIIQDPFERWWKDTGEPLVNSIMTSIAKLAGQGLTGFLTILFSMGAEDAVGDGLEVGSSFAKGFSEGFDGDKVWDAFSGMIERIVDIFWEAIMKKAGLWTDPDSDILNKDQFYDEKGNLRPGVDASKLKLVPTDPDNDYTFGGTYTQKYEYYGNMSEIGKIDNPIRSLLIDGNTNTSYEIQVAGIKNGITEELQKTGSNLDFDSAIAGYEKLEEKEQSVLNTGLVQLRECNQEFGIMAEPKNIEILIKTIDMTDANSGNLGNLGVDIVSLVVSGFGGGKKNSTIVDEAYAKGGILTQPHVGLVAEAGPEAIIPLSGAYKSNGISLWEKAGYLLGTLPKHAEGGIFGEINEKKNGRSYFSLASNAEEEENKSGSEWISNMNTPVQVNLGGVVFNFHGAEAKEQESIMKVIKEQMPTIADEIAGTIAVNIQRIFSNMKKEIV